MERSLRGAKNKSSGKTLLRKRDVRSIRIASVLSFKLCGGGIGRRGQQGEDDLRVGTTR